MKEKYQTSNTLELSRNWNAVSKVVGKEIDKIIDKYFLL